MRLSLQVRVLLFATTSSFCTTSSFAFAPIAPTLSTSTAAPSYPFPLAAMQSGESTTTNPVEGDTYGDYFTTSYKPNLPLPSPLLSLTPGTWAYDTMTRRIDSEILQRTFDENKDNLTENPDFASALEKFQALRSELQNSANTPLTYLDPLPDNLKHDPVRIREYNEWQQILKSYVDKEDTWLSTPWLVAEFYLYRRLLQTIDYFNPKSLTYQYDLFHSQKQAGLYTSLATAEPILEQLNGLGDKPVKDGMSLAAAFALWGNKMDLSIWPADTKESAGVPGLFQEILASANDNLLHDDTESLVNYGQELKDKNGGIVDIVVDNAGFELIMDLALADYLIDSGVAKVVRFQLKSHPLFVSDALEKDLREHVEYYANSDETAGSFKSCKAAGERWLQYLESGKWQCNEDSFWVQPPPMWEMPADLRSDMESRCDLAFIKGDANYRRLLGDLEWDFSAPFEDVVGHYFPCPVCALRTLKAEVGCGMEKKKVENAKSLDADNWSTNGRFGVVHFSMGASSSN